MDCLNSVPMVLNKQWKMESEKLLPRGIRNNNPGNIKLGTNWDGSMLTNRTDDVFCIV
jgi:hypothetical protein